MAVRIDRRLLRDGQINDILVNLDVKPKLYGYTAPNGKYIKPKITSSVKAFKIEDVIVDDHGNEYNINNTYNIINSATTKVTYVRVPFWYAHVTYGLDNDTLNHTPIVGAQRKLPPRDDEQKQIINKIVVELNTYRTALLESPPGSGKTSMTIMVITLIGKRAIVYYKIVLY